MVIRMIMSILRGVYRMSRLADSHPMVLSIMPGVQRETQRGW